MISLKCAPEPADFDKRVRVPGSEFVSKNKNPSSSLWKTHNYWIRAKNQLYAAYRGICAYTCHLIPADTGSDTVEHFVPKSVRSSLAYEWTNYRLVCGRLNGRKGTFSDVIDPFLLEPGFFVMEFPALLIVPNASLSDDKKLEGWRTIRRLRLNDDETCVVARQHYVVNYCKGHIDFAYMAACAPFLAQEIKRQGLEKTIRTIMSIAQVP